MNKKGIVMNIDKGKVGIITSSGEFVYVKALKTSPDLGEIFEGEELVQKSLLNKNVKRFSLIAASLAFIIFFSSFIWIYNTPVSAVTIDINPSIKLETNRWGKIIKISALNEDGKNVISDLSLKRKTLEEGISLIIKEAEKENYITEDYKSGTKYVSLNFEGNTSKINIDYIEKDLKNLDLQFNIQSTEVNKTYSKENKSLEKDKNINSKEDNKSNNSSLDKKEENPTTSGTSGNDEENYKKENSSESESKTNNGQNKEKDKPNPENHNNSDNNGYGNDDSKNIKENPNQKKDNKENHPDENKNKENPKKDSSKSKKP